MDQDIGSEAPADPAAMAFDALRREVALLNAALSGLAAERASVPDYSETLGEIAQGVKVAHARLGKLATSPALALSPTEMARQITAAGEVARLQDHAAWRQAQDSLQRATGDLRGWVDTARLASVQNWRLLQTALAGVVGGAVFGASFPIIVAQAAPAQWAWPEKRAARVLRLDMWPAGERLLTVADPQRWQEMQAARRIVEQNRDVLARCVTAARKAKGAKRCLISVDALTAS